MEVPLIPIAFLIAFYYLLRYLWELVPVGDLAGKAVFISGCDSGFGRALAVKCARAGITVFAGCFTKDGPESLLAEASGLPLKTVHLDVRSDDSVAKARQHVGENLGGKKLWAVVANAGIFSCYGPDDWCTIEDYKQSLEVNTLGVIRCVQGFMDLIKEAEGRVVAVSSVAGRYSVSGGAPYSVAKYGVEAYIDAVRQETYHYNVKCSILEPGIFRTTLLDKDAMNKRVDTVWQRLSEQKKELWGEEFKEFFKNRWNEKFHAFGSSHIEYVVDNYFHAITALFPRHRYPCGWDAIFFYIPLSFMPSFLQDALIRQIAQTKGDTLPTGLQRKLNKKCL